MPQFASQIDGYVEMLRHGDDDKAFHGLSEMGRGILPELITVFRREQDVAVRELLVRVIGEYRDRSAIPFLGEILFDPEPRVWKQAIDGLVTLACPAALDAMRGARTRDFVCQREAEEFRGWLEEAIQQAEAEGV